MVQASIERLLVLLVLLLMEARESIWMTVEDQVEGLASCSLLRSQRVAQET